MQLETRSPVSVPRLLPMLAVPSIPFDDEDWLFETKWDGVRALALVERDRLCLWGREAADYSGR